MSDEHRYGKPGESRPAGIFGNAPITEYTPTLPHLTGFNPIGHLAKALSAAQGEFPKVEKNRTANAGSYSYKYCDLTDIIEVIKPILAKNGLSFVQPYQILPTGQQVLETQLIHSSGEKITSQMLMPDPSKVKPQDFGGVSTYFKRYALTAILGISSDEDTDGPKADAGKGAKPPYQGREPSRAPSDVKVTEKQLARLHAIAKTRGLNHEGIKDLARSIKIMGSSKDMNREQYDNLVAAIETLP